MILLTGATGLLGAHIVEAGLARGERIRAVVRTVPERSYLARVRDRVELVSWDLLAEDPPPADAFRDVHAVIHAAALASPFAEDEPKMRALNVDATRRLSSHARAAAVTTWVQISSIATLSGGQAPVTTEEAGVPRDTAYAHTKAMADEILAAESGLDVLTIHPTFMLGPWDARPSSGAVLVALRMKRIEHYVDVVKNIVDAEDVARGVWQALEKGATGHYILGGIDVPLGQFFAEASLLLGIEPPRAIAEVPRIPTPELDARRIAILRELCTPSPSSSAKAERDVGYQARTELVPLLRRTLAYFAEHRIVLPKKPRPG